MDYYTMMDILILGLIVMSQTIGKTRISKFRPISSRL